MHPDFPTPALTPSQQAFNEWLDIKAQEKQAYQESYRRRAALSMLPPWWAEGEPVNKERKESGWHNNFGTPAATLTHDKRKDVFKRDKVIRRTGKLLADIV